MEYIAPRTILLVDPDVIWTGILRRHLTSADYEPIITSTGREGLEAMSREPAVILLELHLPDMPGLEFARRVRLSRSAGEIMLAALTCDERQQAVEDCLGETFDHYLCKASVTLPDILSVIRELRMRLPMPPTV